MNMFTLNVAFAFVPYGIRANTILSALTTTNTKKQQRENDSGIWQERSQAIPLESTSVSDDYAGAAIYLASEEASLTESKIVIDGRIPSYYSSTYL